MARAKTWLSSLTLGDRGQSRVARPAARRPAIALPTTSAPPRRGSSCEQLEPGASCQRQHGLRLRAGGRRAGIDRDARRVAAPRRPGAAAGCAHRRRRHAAAAALGRIPARAAGHRAVRTARTAAAVAAGVGRWPKPAWCWCRRWRSTAAACGWAGAGVSTTARWCCRDPHARLIAVVRDEEAARRIAGRAARRPDDARADAATGIDRSAGADISGMRHATWRF